MVGASGGHSMTRKARAQKNAPQMRQKARQAIASRLSELRMLCAACADIEHRLNFAQQNGNIVDYDHRRVDWTSDSQGVGDIFAMFGIEFEPYKPNTSSASGADSAANVEALFEPIAQVPGTLTKENDSSLKDAKPNVSDEQKSQTSDGSNAAKKELAVLSRVAELRKQGLWSEVRLPLCADPKRTKTHWDFLLEEVQWMSKDFEQEKKHHRMQAKRLAMLCARKVQEKEMAKEREEAETLRIKRKHCADIARMVRKFWESAHKIVDYRTRKIAEEKKKRSLDKQLARIVGETEKFSTQVQEGLNEAAAARAQLDSSRATSALSGQASTDATENSDYETESEEDDETTIARAERRARRVEDVGAEIAALQREAELGEDDWMNELPEEYVRALQRGDKLPDFGDTSIQSSSEEPSTEEEESGNEETDERMPMADAEHRLQSVNYERLAHGNTEERQHELEMIAEAASALQPRGITVADASPVTPIPFLLRGTLREYQHVGLDWLVTLHSKNLNGILADEMGLGKTIQTIALLTHLACQEGNWGPHLIVVPTSTLINWEMEFKRWCPAFKVLAYYGSAKERARKRQGWMATDAFHVCITSYTLAVHDNRCFKARKWQYLVLDEAHNIKNFKSQRWQLLLNIRTAHRLLLTGTPLQNNLLELWALMHFLMPQVFASHRDFDDWFGRPLTEMIEGGEHVNGAIVKRLHKVLRPFILRRLKAQVEQQLPAKIEHIIPCALSRRQRILYDDFMARATTKHELQHGGMVAVLNVLMQLRKVCNHPNLFESRPVESPFVVQPLHHYIPSALIGLYEAKIAVCPNDTPPSIIPSKRDLNCTVGDTIVKRPPRFHKKVWRYVHTSIDEPQQSTQGRSVTAPRPSRIAERHSAQMIIPIETIRHIQGQAHSGAFWLRVNSNDEGTSHSYIPVNIGESQAAVVDYQTRLTTTTTDGPPPPPVLQAVRTSDRRTIIVRPLDYKPATSDTKPSTSVNHSTVVYSTSGTPVITARLESAPKTIPTARRQVSGGEAIGCTMPYQSATQEKSTPQQVLNDESASTEVHSVMATVRATVMSESPRQDGSVINVVPGMTGALKKLMKRSAPKTDDEAEPAAKRSRQNALPNGDVEDIKCSLDIKPSFDYLRLSELDAMRHSTRHMAINRALWWRTAIERLESQFARTPAELLSIWRDEMPHLHSLHKGLERLARPFFVYTLPCTTAVAPQLRPVASAPQASVRRSLAQVNAELAVVHAGVTADEHTQSVARMLCFPETRLIEYDCGKLQRLGRLLQQLRDEKHRCLIFTQMSRMLDVLEAFLAYHDFKYLRLDGATPIDQRQFLMEQFNQDPRIFVFILSTRSGGLGINLTGADTVIFYDSDWNPTMDAQAQDRCHRIGQTRDVHVYRLISSSTIEEAILEKAQQKRKLGDIAIDQAGFTLQFFQQNNLRDLFGNVAIDRNMSAPRTQADLEQALATVEDADDVRAAKVAGREPIVTEATEDVDIDEDGDDDTFVKLEEQITQHIRMLRPIEQYAVNCLQHMKSDEIETIFSKATEVNYKASLDTTPSSGPLLTADELNEMSLTYAHDPNSVGADSFHDVSSRRTKVSARKITAASVAQRRTAFRKRGRPSKQSKPTPPEQAASTSKSNTFEVVVDKSDLGEYARPRPVVSRRERTL